MSVYSDFTYDVSDINQNIRKTGTLLRAANNIRNLVNDLKDLWDRPTATKFMWTLIQISRTYTGLRRLYRVVQMESNLGASLAGIPIGVIIKGTGVGGGGGVIEDLNLSHLNVRIDAFRDNLPMGLRGIDISGLPESSMKRLQRVLEEDAEETVADAKAILTARILHPESSTGFLESSIYWQPEVFGTRIVANAPYAWWVEQGQRKFAGHWYMSGATELARQRLPQKITQELNYLITQES